MCWNNKIEACAILSQANYGLRISYTWNDIMAKRKAYCAMLRRRQYNGMLPSHVHSCQNSWCSQCPSSYVPLSCINVLLGIISMQKWGGKIRIYCFLYTLVISYLLNAQCCGSHLENQLQPSDAVNWVFSFRYKVSTSVVILIRSTA